MKAPLSWPQGARDVNERDANVFAAERHLNLFWCEDLCAAPRSEIDELALGSWTRHSRFARQAVALDYESVCTLAEVVPGDCLTLEYLLDWFCEDRRGATKAMEVGLPAATYAHIRLLCDLLTVDPTLIERLRVEYQAREDARQTLRFGRRVEDEERQERSTVDMSKPTGTRQLRRRARGEPRSSQTGGHTDDEAIIAAGAQALHEQWRREDEVQGRPFFKDVPEAEFTAWFDPRFHDTFTRQRQKQVNMNVPLGYLPPSLQAETRAVASSVLAALQKLPPGPSGISAAVTREAVAARVHEEWLARRANELKVITEKQEAQMFAIKLSMTGDQLDELSTQGTSPFQVANSSSQQEPWPVQPKWYPLKGPMDSDVAFATLPQHYADADLECVDLCISAFQRMAKRQPQLLMPPAANVTKSDHLLRITPANTPASNAIVPRFPSIASVESVDSTALTAGFSTSQSGSVLGLGSALGAPPPPPQPLVVLQDLKGRDCTVATRESPEEIVAGLGRLRSALVMAPSSRLEREPEPQHHHHHHRHGHYHGHHHHHGGDPLEEHADTTHPPSSQIVPVEEAAHNLDAPHPSPAVRPIVTLNLCCVDLSGVASKPPPGAANFLDHLAQFQKSIFDEMKPRAKALLQGADSSLLRHLPAPDLPSAHRSKVDARSTLPGSISMNTDLLLRGSTELSPAAAASAQRKLLLQAKAANDFDGSSTAAGSQRGSPTPGSPEGFTSPSRSRGSPQLPPSSNRKGSPTSSQASQGASPKPAGNSYGPDKAPNLAAAQALLLQTQIHLTTLLMRQCSLSTGCLYKLRHEGLNSCSALTVLDVSDNAFLKSDGCKQVALGLSALPQLKCLGVRRTCCAGDGAVLLLKALRYHRVLTVDLSHNSLGVPEGEGAGKGPIMKGLRTLVKTNLHLTHLDLSFNNFRADASRKLGDWLKQNMSIFGLHFAGNGHTVVDSRGFLRERASLPLDAGLGPARVVEYPSNPILPAHRDKCWICGRWASTPISFKLDLAALPPPPPPKRKARKGKSGKAARSSVAAATAPSSGASAASASSSIASNPDQQADGTPGGLLYKTIVVTLHLSCDDPPYAATPMEESHDQPHEDGDDDGTNDDDASGHMRTATVVSSAPNSARSDPSTARSHSPLPPGTSKTYKLTRMVPPGQLQYYFLVFGDGILLTRYAGPKLEPDSPHSCHFGFPPRKHHAPPSKESTQLPNYAMLVRPDAFARDPLPNPTAVQLPPPVVAVDCGFVKIAPCEKILKILREKREPDFKTHSLEDPADESLASLDEDDDENNADSDEEEVEWHPRISEVFMPRAVESFGSFFDNEFDTGPKEREKSAAEIANENASVGALSSAASFGAANASSAMPPGGGDDGRGFSKQNNRSPVELAFDSDAKSLDRLMKSGLKYARAFFPAEITDRFTPEGMAPKPNHKSHDAQKRELMLTLLQAAAEEEVRLKRMRAEAAGEVFRDESETTPAKKHPGGIDADDDDDEEEEKLDPVKALFGLIAKHFGAIDCVHKQYAFVNSRSPFSMSVQSWLLFAKDTNLDALVTFDTPKHNHSSGNGAAHTGRSNTEAKGGGSILPPVMGAQNKVGGTVDIKKEAARRGSSHSVASVQRPRDDLEVGLGREAKMALEVVFFTATGSEDDENSSDNDGGAAAAAGGSGGGEAAGKKTSAITLTFSKHDMRRKQFVLGLLALTRYRQRHMKRPRKRSIHLGTARSTGLGGGRPSEGAKHPSTNFNNNDAAEEHRMSEGERANLVPGSADEFLYILEHEVLPVALGPLAKRFSGDLFRTQILYQPAVEAVLLPHAATLEEIYKQYKLTVMGCGSPIKQLALAGWLKMLKDAEVLGEASACLTLGEATQSFLEARLAASAETVVGDRGLSLVDFKEALVRTATRMHGHWPFPIKEIKVLSYEEAQAAEAAAAAAEASADLVAGGGGVAPVLENDSGDESSVSDGEGGDHVDDASSDSSGSDDGSLSTAAMLEKQRKKADEARAAEEALKKGLFGDPAFASTHATVCTLTELLIQALRDRDAAGLKHFHEQRPRVLDKVAHSFEPPPPETTPKRASNAWKSLRSSIRGPSAQGSAAAAAPASAPPQLSPAKQEAKREASLEAVAELAVQSLIVHKAKAKRRTPAASRDADDDDDLS